MNFSDAVQKINEKYHGIIVDKYGPFLTGPYSRVSLATDVEIVSEQKCIGENCDLKTKRGKCTYATGKIVLRENAFIQGSRVNEHLLVHEHIHRIACNQKRRILGFEWGSGFDFFDKKVNWTIFNELMTEWLAFKITRYNEDTPYQRYLSVIEDLQTYLGEERFSLLIKAYFKSDLDERNKWFYHRYGYDYQNVVLGISQRIIERYSL